MIFLKYIATLGFIGYLPFAPGTFGTLAAFVFMAVLKPSVYLHIALTLLVVITGLVSSGKAEELFGQKDSQHIVIDEFAGYLVSVLFIPLEWKYLIGGFIMFRFFDIIKPPPVKKAETAFKDGFGVMADDIMAGVYANLALQLWKLLN